MFAIDELWRKKSGNVESGTHIVILYPANQPTNQPINPVPGTEELPVVRVYQIILKLILILIMKDKTGRKERL